MDGKAFLSYLIKTQQISREQAQRSIQESVAQKIPLLQVLVRQQYFSAETLKQHLKNFQNVQQDTILTSTPTSTSTKETNFFKDPISQEETLSIRLQETISLEKVESSIGKYQLLEEIARGGMGVVYKAKHRDLGQIRALKVISAGTMATTNDIARFEREAKMCAKLQHPHLVQVFDFGQEQGYWYLCMEYVEGATLKEYLEEKHSLSEILELFQKILEALHYAHKQGILHRDLKPANILMTKENEPKVGDFGLAKEIHLSDASPHVTKTGEILGTPAYMAPEQIGGDTPLEPTSDIYSIGVCLYEVLTGERPFQGKTLHELFYKIVTDEAIPPSKIVKSLSKDLDIVLLKALDKTKEKRYSSALLFAEDLRRIQHGYPILARPVSSFERLKKWGKRNKTFVGMAIFMLILLIVGLGREFQMQYLEQQKKLQEKKARFQHYFTQALQFKQSQTQQTDDEKIQPLLPFMETLNLLNQALNEEPLSLEATTLKKEIGQKLIELACAREEFELAAYVVKDLKSLPDIELQTQQMEAFVLESQQKRLKKHLASLETWITYFKKSSSFEAETVEMALLEISKMPEPEIFDRLKTILEESLTYFLTQQERLVSTNEFYRVFIKALGMLENKNAGPLLIEALQKMAESLSQFSLERRPDAEIQYMIQLAQALAFVKPSGFAARFMNICLLMGENSLFYERTRFVAKILATQDQLLYASPKTPSELYNRAEIKFLQHDFSGAIQDLNHLIVNFPQNTDGYKLRGMCKKRLKEYESALQDYNQVLQINPQDDAAYLERGNLKNLLKRYAEALDDYSRSIQYHPRSFEAYHNRGLVKETLGDVEGSLHDYNKSIELNPVFYHSYHHRGILKRTQGNWQGALEDYTRALQFNPNNATIYLSRGEVKMQLSDYDGALEDFNLALQKNTASAEGYVNRGTIKELKEDYAGALADYSEAIRLNSENPENYKKRADLKKNKLKDRERAKEDYRQYLELTKENTDPRIKTWRRLILLDFPDLKK